MRLTIPVILIVIAAVAMHVYQREIALKLQQHAYQNLRESANTQVIAFNVALEGKYEIVESFANLAVLGKEFDIEKIILYMEKLIRVSKFSSVGYADIEGNAYLHNGKTTKINDREYFRKAIKGERAIEWVKKDNLEGKARIIISVPIKDENGVKGIIFASYTDENFRKFLNPQGFGKEGYSHVCNVNGDIIASSKKYDFLTDNQNIFESLRSGTLDNGYTLEQRIADVQNHTPGIFSYKIHGQHRYANYQPIGVNDWIIFNVVPASIVNTDFNVIVKSGQISMVIVLLSAISLILFIIILDMKQTRALRKEHEQLLISEEEYRITAEQSGKLVFRYDINTKTQYNQPKMAEVLGLPLIEKNMPESSIESGLIAEESIEDYKLFYDAMLNGAPEGIVVALTRIASGEFIWYRGMFTMVYSDAGQPLHAIVSLENFTIQREKELAYKRWQQKLDSIQRKKITYYECNLTKDLCEREDKNLPYQILGSIDTKFSTMLDYAVKHLIFDEDINSFERFFSRKRMLADFYQDTTNDIFEYRTKKEDGTFNWIKASIQMVQDPYSADIKALIMFEDIDELKCADLLLQTQAKKDPLTGVLNRNEFVCQMTALIDEGDALAQHAFIMIDIDDFKDINDMFGHIEGDKALVEITDNLKKIMRCGDLLGRLGGDEFMICLKNIPNDEVISKRAELISQMTSKQLSPKITLTVSIGIAVCPRDGTTFEELYAKADIALYQAKEDGHGLYRLYDSEMKQNTEKLIITPIDFDSTTEYSKEEKLTKTFNSQNDVARQQDIEDELSRLVIEEDLDGLIVWNVEDGTYYRSEGFEQYEMSNLTNEEFFDMYTQIPGVHPKDEEVFRDFYTQHMKVPESEIKRTLHILKKESGYINCEIMSTRKRDDNNKLKRILITIRELPEQEKIT